MVIDDRRGNFDFPGKDESETVQFYFRPHWMRLAWKAAEFALWVLGYVLGIALLLSIAEGADELRHAGGIILTIIFCIVSVRLLQHCYTYFLAVVIVTDRKIHHIERTLIVKNDYESVNLWMLDNIFMHQAGVTQNLLGYGTLELIMQAQNVGLVLKYVPNVADKHRQIMALREYARSQNVPKLAEEASGILEAAKNAPTPENVEEMVEEAKEKVEELKEVMSE